MNPRDNVYAILSRYSDTDFKLLRDREEQAIADSLTAAGFNVIRTEPTDEVAVNIGTLGRLRAAFDAMSRDPWSPGPVGMPTGWTVVLDDSLPDDAVHFRPSSASRDIDAEPAP